MGQALTSQQITRRGFFGFGARIGAIVTTMAAEHALALRAANKAALQRRKLTELRAMYVRPLER
jgi:hypothetical protein